jgi:hypothetical protein
MGIFKHKDKTHQDLLNPNTVSTNNSSPAPAPTTNDSFNDSTYYSSSSTSNADTQRAIQNQQQAQGKPPGTTVTTTTTTTTSKKPSSQNPYSRRYADESPKKQLPQSPPTGQLIQNPILTIQARTHLNNPKRLSVIRTPLLRHNRLEPQTKFHILPQHQFKGQFSKYQLHDQTSIGGNHPPANPRHRQ